MDTDYFDSFQGEMGIIANLRLTGNRGFLFPPTFSRFSRFRSFPFWDWEGYWLYSFVFVCKFWPTYSTDWYFDCDSRFSLLLEDQMKIEFTKPQATLSSSSPSWVYSLFFFTLLPSHAISFLSVGSSKHNWVYKVRFGTLRIYLCYHWVVATISLGIRCSWIVESL